MFFVNLSLRALLDDPDRLDRMLGRGLNLELGLDPALMDAVDEAWHEARAETLRRSGAAVGLHLPFFDLQPGGADALIRQASLERLRRGMAIARIYQPGHLIGHAAYDRFLYVKSYPAWRDRCAATWADALAVWPDFPGLRLENVHETDPATVAGLVEALRALLPADQAERTGLCLDVGHWHSFAMGATRQNLDQWLDAFAPFLGHLHLHDNDGSFDQHRAPGRGGVPFEELFEGLARRGLNPAVTFEPHSEEDLDATLRWAMESVAGRSLRRPKG